MLIFLLSSDLVHVGELLSRFIRCDILRRIVWDYSDDEKLAMVDYEEDYIVTQAYVFKFVCSQRRSRKYRCRKFVMQSF